mmetsp:Transcript_81176/g.225938  ORF Transcript_81176/g.225938 Transcript_81176/m.225938 type:complete len:83 (-) Transcript_81176:896-1144(-)
MSHDPCHNRLTQSCATASSVRHDAREEVAPVAKLHDQRHHVAVLKKIEKLYNVGVLKLMVNEDLSLSTRTSKEVSNVAILKF